MHVIEAAKFYHEAVEKQVESKRQRNIKKGGNLQRLA